MVEEAVVEETGRRRGRSAKTEAGQPPAADPVLALVLRDLKKRLGTKASPGIMGDGAFSGEPKEFFSTGSFLLDCAIGGGFPIGRFSEVFGDVATGKSLLILTAMARAQAQGALCFYLDTERGSSRKFAMNLCGVDVEALIHLEPETQEDLWQSVEQIIGAAREENQDRAIFIGID